MAVLLALLLSATAWRIYKDYAPASGEFDWSRRGYSDFHNGTYLPTRAFVDGHSPYSSEVASDYRMARAAPPFSPIVFLIHIPFALLPLKIASVAFYVYSAVLVASLAWCSLKMSRQRFRRFDFLAFTNLLLISRPGHMTLYTGYFTLEIVLGCIVAIHFAKTRPAISGWGILLASIKPNFFIPLALLLAFRGNYRAVLWGSLLCVLGASVGFGWLGYHNGLLEVFESVRSGQESLHVDPTEMPVNTWTRVDLVGMCAKVLQLNPTGIVYLAAMLLIVSAVGLCLRSIADRESNSGASGPSALIIALTILVCVYHHSYECLLFAVPVLGLLFFGRQTMPEIPSKTRLLVGVLLSVTAVNYVSTLSVRGYFGLEPLGFGWQTVTLINGLCIVSALVLLLASPKQVNT